MFVNDNHFNEWMEKLFKRLNEIGKDLKSLINTNEVFDKDDIHNGATIHLPME